MPAASNVFRQTVNTSVFVCISICAPTVGQGASVPITGTNPATRPFVPSAQALVLNTNFEVLNSLNTICNSLLTLHAQLIRTSAVVNGAGSYGAVSPVTFAQLVAQAVTVLQSLVATLAEITPRNATDAAYLQTYQIIAENSYITVSGVAAELN